MFGAIIHGTVEGYAYKRFTIAHTNEIYQCLTYSKKRSLYHNKYALFGIHIVVSFGRLGLFGFDRFFRGHVQIIK